MAKLIYSAMMSLDGYIEDKSGKFDWAAPDDEVHAFVNDLVRPAGTFLYGRRMYATMVAWENAADDPAFQTAVMQDFASIWRAAEKIVYSSTLNKVSSAKTRIETAFDPDAVRRIKGSAARDVFIGGPSLATHAFKAALVDECHLLVVPVIVGGGKRGLPSDVFLTLELAEERRFKSGVVYLRYRCKR